MAERRTVRRHSPGMNTRCHDLDVNAPAPADGSGRPTPPTPPRVAARSSRRVIGGLVAVLALVGLAAFVVAVLPRWWAHRVGEAADGRFSTAIWLGLSVGLVATALPLAVFARAFGRRRADGDDGGPPTPSASRDGDRGGAAAPAADAGPGTAVTVPVPATIPAPEGEGRAKVRRAWGGRSLRRRVALLVTGVVLAGPNLLTLGIELGNGSAAHAADRTLDVQAPGFRGATAVGAALALALMILLAVLVRSRRRRGEELRQVRRQLEEARRPAGERSS